MNNQEKNEQPACLAAEKPADGADWRTEEMDNKQLYAHLLETGEGADVHFLVGKPDEEKELIAAHKIILLAGSSVFERQFSFGNTIHSQEGTEEKPIEVQDVRPNAFRAMQKFMYSEDFSGVNKQYIMDVFYAAKKYMLYRLIKQCRQSLFNEQNLDETNALSVLKHSQQHEDKELVDHCWSFVDKNVKAILDSDEFLILNQHDLCELFSRDDLAVEELFLFQSLHRWAIHQLESTELENTAENLRDIIGLAIYQIRFPLFTAEEFTQTIVPTRLLNEKDMLALYVHFNGNLNCTDAKSQFPNRFNCQPRCVCKTKLEWNNNKWHISDQRWVHARADGLTVVNTEDAWTNVRAQHHTSCAILALIPGQKLVYWEMQMKKKRAFGIGWVGPNVPLNDDEWIGDQPGSFSIDHMGDYWELGGIVADGYGKEFVAGDVVGSGMLLTHDHRFKLFFTKNGALNGEPIVLEDGQDLLLYPALTLYEKDVSVEANFGADPVGKPFEFDVNNHMAKLFQ